MSLLRSKVDVRPSAVGISLILSLVGGTQVQAGNPATNTATVTTPDGSDYNPENNTATDSDPVIRLSLG